MKVAINYQISRKFIRLQVTDESQDIKCMKVSKVPLKDNAITGSLGLAISSLFIGSSGLDTALKYRLQGEMGLKFLVVLTDSILKG